MDNELKMIEGGFDANKRFDEWFERVMVGDLEGGRVIVEEVKRVVDSKKDKKPLLTQVK